MMGHLKASSLRCSLSVILIITIGRKLATTIYICFPNTLSITNHDDHDSALINVSDSAPADSLEVEQIFNKFSPFFSQFQGAGK